MNWNVFKIKKLSSFYRLRFILIYSALLKHNLLFAMHDFKQIIQYNFSNLHAWVYIKCIKASDILN